MGHILRAESLLEEANAQYARIDDIPKKKEWNAKYTVCQDLDGLDVTTGMRLYTDGSKLDENSGYGAVLMSNEDICDETFGSIGQ